MALDPRYIPAFSIEEVLLNKDTGAPLSGGLVYFEQDNQRGVLKPVYQITGTSPNYTYIQLPNPVVLSSIGTFEDSLGNPVIPYFYPYDEAGNVEYYYVRVTSSEDVAQFDREAVPYVPLSNTSEVLSVITNELSNPQFSVVSFDQTSSSYTYNFSAVTNEVVNIAPDWDLIVSAPAAGTVTLSQLKPDGSLNIITNPGTLLTISSSGLTKLQLRQRLYGSPNLWGSGYFSASFVAKTYSGTEVTVNMYYSQSNGVVVDQLLVSATLPSNGEYVAFPGNALIPDSTSSDNFPTAYIDIYFDIPLSVQIDITSAMVAFTGESSINNISYDQESFARQVDHLYHNAYPIVPIGTVIDYHGFGVPDHYYACDGSAKNRITDQQLFNVLTKVDTVTWTGVNTFTVASSADYWIGMPVEGASIPAATTISNIATNTITISNNRTGTDTAVRFFSVGVGDGSTTFNLPLLQDYVVAGVGGSLFGSTLNGVGYKGGSATHLISATEMPAHTHNSFIVVGGAASPGANNSIVGSSGSTVATSSAGGTDPMTIVQQTALLRKCIRFE